MQTAKRWLLGAGAAWDTGWKLAALWRAYHRRDWKWMPVLLTINSVGALPMLYLFFTRRKDAGRASGGAGT